jgi:hypothetical protein
VLLLAVINQHKALFPKEIYDVIRSVTAKGDAVLVVDICDSFVWWQLRTLDMQVVQEDKQRKKRGVFWTDFDTKELDVTTINDF